MKCFTPEIAWNSKEAIYSVDFQVGRNVYRLASAGIDKDIKIWRIGCDTVTGQPSFLSNLRGHQQTVNVVRFAPTGDSLASGDVDGMVIIWQLNTAASAPDIFADDDSVENLESWTCFKRLRSHLQDVSDVSWSSDAKKLLSASVDKSIIIWDVVKGTHLKIIRNNHKHYIVGIKWDPTDRFIVSVSKDRSFVVYNAINMQRLQTVAKAVITNPFKDSEMCCMRLFHDDNLMSFARRPDFSPDGRFLAVPAGCLESGVDSLECSYLFSTSNFDKPCLILPSPSKPTVGVRWCPQLFELKPGSENLLRLRYRMIFAVLTLDAVVLYDTQQAFPIGYASNIHYANLTDVAWSADGRMLIISSVDAFCTFVIFDEEELGVTVKQENKPTPITAAITDSPTAPKSLLKLENGVRNTSLTEGVVSQQLVSTENQLGKTTPIAEKLKKFEYRPQDQSEVKTPSSTELRTNNGTPRRVPIVTLAHPLTATSSTLTPSAEKCSDEARSFPVTTASATATTPKSKEKQPRKVSFITLP